MWRRVVLVSFRSRSCERGARGLGGGGGGHGSEGLWDRGDSIRLQEKSFDFFKIVSGAGSKLKRLKAIRGDKMLEAQKCPLKATRTKRDGV
jgi:hypothetical protein